MADHLICVAMSGQSMYNICRQNFLLGKIATGGIMSCAREHI